MYPIVDSVEKFAEEWRRLRSSRSLASRLTDFAAIVRPLLFQSKPVLKRIAPVSVAALERTIASLRPLIEAHTERGDGLNIWSAAGLSTDERRNVGGLAQLWMRASMGKVSTDFLKAFLNRVQGAERVDLSQGYRIHTEHRPMNDGAHRIDLVIETRNAIIGIEAKIQAPPDPEQMARYARELRARAEHKGPSCISLLIFLGPYPCSFNCALSSTWDDVVSAARAAARNSNGNSRRLLFDFAEHIAHFGR